MKPAPFEYLAPDSLEAALEANAASDGARILAGGQSLLPLLNLRRTSADVLIDLDRVPSLDYIAESDGAIAIGAMTRQQSVERSTLIARRVPLLSEALRYVGHWAVRTRGTVCGSLMHADPIGEIPTTLVALDGRVRVARYGGGERWIAAGELFAGPFRTTLDPQEIALEAVFPALAANTGASFVEVGRRARGVGLVGVASQVAVVDGTLRNARLAIGGVGEVPVRAREAELLLDGATPDDGAALVRAADAAREALSPTGDRYGSSEYRRHVAGVLIERAVKAAAARVTSLGTPE